jgi:hypothetical protein
MGTQLIPCPSCARHLRCSERTCPFCGEAVPERACAPATSPSGPLTRAAILFAGATAAAGCTTGLAPAYGPAPIQDSGQVEDSGQDSAQVEDSGQDSEAGPAPTDSGPDQGPVAAYGPAPVDAGEG